MAQKEEDAESVGTVKVDLILAVDDVGMALWQVHCGIIRSAVKLSQCRKFLFDSYTKKEDWLRGPTISASGGCARKKTRTTLYSAQ